MADDIMHRLWVKSHQCSHSGVHSLFFTHSLEQMIEFLFTCSGDNLTDYQTSLVEGPH